jgi:hypothetical protein
MKMAFSSLGDTIGDPVAQLCLGYSRRYHPADTTMASFAAHFSEETIIEELCRARVKLADRRHEAAFHHNIASAARAPHTFLPSDWGRIAMNIFPSRRAWHRFRPKRRRNMTAADLNQRALYNAVMVLRGQTPKPAWAQALDDVVNRIRSRVLSKRAFRFQQPTIIPLLKQPGGHVYRPLATYKLEDKIIEGLTARYLRTVLDRALSRSCIAFRCRSKTKAPPSTHDALATIVAMRSRYGQALTVAECDIKGFFDCVGHRVARESFDDLAADAKRLDPALVVEGRAREIFDAYLQSYSFANSVRGAAQRELHKRDPQGTFKWPERELQQMYGSDALPPIGVPQGGALSCFIANAVLHRGDKAIAESEQHRTPLLYLRYCDDMILVATTLDACATAFATYQRALRSLLLPVHPPQVIGRYDKQFWEEKSKFPYEWSVTGVPWIQFVGYQIRHDGLLRIRPSSLRKQVTGVTKATDLLLNTLRRAHRQKRMIRRTEWEIRHRLRQKLISMGVGRIVPGKLYHGPRPMCWAAGFRGLAGRLYCHNHLKLLDRHRERQLQRVHRYLQNLSLPQARPGRKRTDARKYYGRPYSYFAQFGYSHLNG